MDTRLTIMKIGLRIDTLILRHIGRAEEIRGLLLLCHRIQEDLIVQVGHQPLEVAMLVPPACPTMDDGHIQRQPVQIRTSYYVSWIKMNRRKVLLSPILILLALASTWVISKSDIHEKTVTVRGNSMSPLIQNEKEIVNQLGYYSFRPIRRGDVVTFRSGTRTNLLIKRVYAIPGDRFEVRGKFLFVNGSPLLNSEGTPFTVPTQMLQLYARDYPQLPPQTYLVLGDQPLGSIDASRFGLIHKKDIVGRIDPSSLRRPSSSE